MKKSSIFLLLALSFFSCGYRWQPDSPDSARPTLTVPFITGDEEGLLTAEVLNALSRSGLVDIVHTGGDYQLALAIQGQSNELVGFRRDPQKVDGKVRKNLLACEGRKGMTLEVTLLKGDTPIQGPYLLTSEVDYDYVDGDSLQDLTFVNPNGQIVTVLPFSLGQLESSESAQEAAERPLFRQLARKIVDQISAAW